MRLVFTSIFRGILSRAKLPLINILTRNFRDKQKTPQTATEKVVCKRGDAASQRELLVCDFAETKPQDVALGCSLSLKIFRYAKHFKGTLNKRSRAKLPRQAKNAANCGGESCLQTGRRGVATRAFSLRLCKDKAARRCARLLLIP